MVNYFMKEFKPNVNPVSNNTVTINFASAMRIPLDQVVSKLNSSIGDREYIKLVNDYYSDILDDIFMKRETGQMSICTQLFTNLKFVMALTQVIHNVQLTQTSRWRLNKMCFDYLMLEDSDKEFASTLLSLSKTTNRDKIPALCVIPLPENIATLLALARYSSDKDIVNVRRLNNVIMNQPASTMTEQMIVDIYLTLFDRVLPLFIGVMLDVISPQMLNESTSEIYGTISLAILDIMNELPIADIKRGLTIFSETRKIQYSNYPLRFNIESFAPDDYPRIYKAINELYLEGVHIETH